MSGMNKEMYELLGKEVFLSALEVHKNLGPGLMESVYEYALAREFQLRNIRADCRVKIPLYYKDADTGKYFFVDILLENEIIIELKAVEQLLPVHQAQLLSYLKLTGKCMGFLINFNVPVLKLGFKRMVNNY